jgi:RNA polymerase-binding protein DksA
MPTKEQIEQLRKQLLAERDRLSQDLENLDPDQLKYDTNSGVGNHPAEDASLVYEQEAVVGLHRDATVTLGMVDDALRRIENGGYGRCERCGREIAFERLQAKPFATLDIECQRLVEENR